MTCRTPMRGRSATVAKALAVPSALVLLACSETTSGAGGGGVGGGFPTPGFDLQCDLPQQYLFDGGVARDAIPALTNPNLVPADHPEAAYLDEYAAIMNTLPEFPDLRVVGLVVDGQVVAIPHNILWWHEIVHLDLGARRYAVTYCPLTGSAIVFDASVARTERFGVSGLLFMNNLVMFDAETESLWPQMMLEARCGARSGALLTPVPHSEMRWETWKTLHPGTQVVSSVTGSDRDYTAYPYDLYEIADYTEFPGPSDDRRRVKERVLGLADGNGGMAFPFAELAAEGALAVVNATVGARSVAVLWDDAAQAAGAFERRSTSGRVTLEVQGGQFVDQETGSVWTVDGRAIEGPRLGEQLIQIPDAFVAFWFAWASFHPETEIWVH